MAISSSVTSVEIACGAVSPWARAEAMAEMAIDLRVELKGKSRRRAHRLAGRPG
jgi:hypothetical protein